MWDRCRYRSCRFAATISFEKRRRESVHADCHPSYLQRSLIAQNPYAFITALFVE